MFDSRIIIVCIVVPDAETDGLFRIQRVIKIPVVHVIEAKLGEIGKEDAHFFHLCRGEVPGGARRLQDAQ